MPTPSTIITHVQHVRVKETPPEQNIWQQGCAALCVTQLLTPLHTFRNALLSFLLALSFHREVETGTRVTHQIK